MQCRCPPPSPFALTAKLAYISIEIKIQCLKYSFYWLLHLDLFYSSKLVLFNTQANADAVQGSTPSPFALTAELAYTSIEIKIQCLKYSFYWLLKLQKHRPCEGYQNNPQTPRILSGTLVLKFLDLPLACVNLHSYSGTCKKKIISSIGWIYDWFTVCNISDCK